MTSALVIVGGVLLLLALIVHRQIMVPLSQLREAIHRLAVHDYRPVLLPQSWRVFRRTAMDIRKISELLDQLDRQREDEGFSLRAILSGMVEGVLITDRFQQVRLVNDPLLRMFDLRQSPVGRAVIEVFRNHQLQQALEHTFRTGTSRKIEMALTNGRQFEVYASRLNPGSGGRPIGAVVVFHDITTVRNLEMVRRDFMANVSHEFRTPLTIINGYIETLLDGAIEDRGMAEKSLRAMHRNGERLTLLIDDLLSITTLEQRAVRLDFQPVSLPEMVRHLLDQMEPMLGDHQAVVEVEWEEGIPEIEADSLRLDQLFTNLLENALRHGSARGMRITISGRQVLDSLEITVADNGPGIPLDDQPHIFERFYRVHKDRSRAAGGTGLGLSIVKHIVQAHGGDVSVRSTPGSGATFLVRLPVRQEFRGNSATFSS